MSESRQMKKYREYMGESATDEEAMEAGNALGRSVNSYQQANQESLGLEGADMHTPVTKARRARLLGDNVWEEYGMPYLSDAFSFQEAGLETVQVAQNTAGKMGDLYDEAVVAVEGSGIQEMNQSADVNTSIAELHERMKVGQQPYAGMQGPLTDWQRAFKSTLGPSQDVQTAADQSLIDGLAKLVNTDELTTTQTTNILGPIQDPQVPIQLGDTGLELPEDIERPHAKHGRRQFEAHIQAAAKEFNLDPNLIAAVMQAESNFKSEQTSERGAEGLMQIMPATGKELGMTDPWDHGQNIRFGAKYLRQMYDQFGSWKLAIAAYNAGPGKMMEYGGSIVPPFKETINYVDKVMTSWGGYN